jgi:hypothetical protein
MIVALHKFFFPKSMYCLRFKLKFVGVNVRYDVQVEQSFSFSQKYLFTDYSNYVGSIFVLSKHKTYGTVM